MEKSVDLTPEGVDAEGWTVFRTESGDKVRVREKDGLVDSSYPKEKYILKTLYFVERTGDVVIDLVQRPTIAS